MTHEQASVTPRSWNTMTKSPDTTKNTVWPRATVTAVVVMFTLPSLFAIATPLVDEGAREAWVASQVSFDAGALAYPGLAIDSAGGSVVVFRDYGGGVNGILHYASRDLMGWQTEAIVAGGMDGPIAFDSSGQAHVAATAIGSGLVYATRNAPGDWSIETITTYEPIFHTVDLKVDSAGKPHIVYIHGNKITYATKPSGSWVLTTLGLDYGLIPRLALDAQGLAHITDRSRLGGVVGQYYAQEHANGSFTYEFIVNCVDADIALDSADVPHVACGSSPLSYYSRTGPATWSSEAVTSSPGLEVRLKIDSQDRPHISFAGPSGATTLGYATKTSMGWWVEHPVQWTTNNVKGTNIALDASDRPIIAYTVSCLTLCLKPGHLGDLYKPWLVEPVLGAPLEAWAAVAQDVRETAGLP